LRLGALNKEEIMEDGTLNFATDPKGYCRAAIADISEQLKGPLDNTERALLVADRKDWRDKLRELEAENNEVGA
jgi:hypothetical protein